jgi:hypothetical protein
MASHDRGGLTVRTTLPPFVLQISGIKANSVSGAMLPSDERKEGFTGNFSLLLSCWRHPD